MQNTQPRFFLGFFALVLIACFPSPAQVATGVPPYGSFTGGPDVVDLEGLNVHIPIPIVSKPGRMIPFVYNYGYDSTIWYPAGTSGSQTWSPVGAWGWMSLAHAGTGYVTYTLTIGNCRVGNGGVEHNHYHYANWIYVGSDGSAHGFVGSTDVFQGGCSGGSTRFTSTATDGSGYTLSATGAGGKVTTTDGTIINSMSFSPTSVVTDRNGNQLTTTSAGVSTDTTDNIPLTVTQGTPPASSTLSYTAPNNSVASFTIEYAMYPVRTNFGCSGISEFGPMNEPLVNNITLPDGSAYTFSYEGTPGFPGDVTGRLQAVTLPTGGVIGYTYSGSNNGITCSNGSTPTLSRMTTPGGTWTYAQNGLGQTTVTDPLGNQTVLNFSLLYETERQTYQGSASSGTLLNTIYTCYNGSAPNCNSTTIYLPITERSVYVQLPGTSGLESRTDTFYNSYGLTTEVDQYAYGAGAPGSLVRKLLTVYNTSLTNGIVDKPASVTVEDGSGNVKSQTTYSYDQGTVTTTSGTPQHVTVSGSRGNATSMSYLVQGSTTLNKTFTYYDTGEVYQATDVNSAVTTYTYGSGTSCGNSFATSISEPLSLSRSMTWNCTGGLRTSVTDENGKTTTTTWNDPYFWRPTSVTDPVLNTANFTYASQTSAEWSLGFGSSTTDALKTSDGFGRVHISQLKESPTSSTYDSVETDYDSLGRPSRTTLPYPAGVGAPNSSTPGTNTTYDALNRATLVADSGGGTKTVGYTYSENDTYQTLGPAPTGENTKRRQSEYDALGRMTSVCEVTSAIGSGSCAQTSPVTGYWTQYTYDVLNDLTGVTQNAQSSGSKQTRTYAYDDLRRVTSDSNPESGTTSYTYDTDSTCGTSYGDLVKKIDAVGNTTCYAYDALHRVTSSTYSGPYSSSTPSRYFVYDTATVNSVTMANAKTRMAEAYTCISPCSTKITDLGFSYTVLGQATDVYESTPHSSGYYHVTGTYYANGALNQLSNLVGLPTITYVADGEGRVNSVSASSGQNPLASTMYNTASLPTQVNLGSSDSDSFTFDPNTNRMNKYTFTVNGQSVIGTLSWNAIATLGSLAITDAFYTGGNQTCSYTHDDISRIASANCGSPWAQTFSYDAFGNLSKNGTISFQPTYSYLTNRMTQVGSSTPTYDADGNVLNDTAHTYTWDANGRPVTVDGVGLTYDALGRTVEQNKSGVYREIAYAPGGGKLAIMSAQMLQEAFVPLTGGAVAVYNSSGLAYYRHSDWLGSSRVASTPARALYFDGAYAPFGENYAQTGTTDFSFTGMNQDTVANLFDFPDREYNAIHGRWPSPDPAGLGAASTLDPQSLNRYAYVGNRPLSSTDPTGECPSGCRRFPPNMGSFYCAELPLNCGENFVSFDYGTPIWGNDIFDAIGGVPGTYLYTDMYGNVGFGWSYSLYVVTQNEIDSLKGPLPFVEWMGNPKIGTVGPQCPPDQTCQPDQGMSPIPQAFFAVTMAYNGMDTSATGFVPDLLSLESQEVRDQFIYEWTVKQCGQNSACVSAATANWGPYLQYDRDRMFDLLGTLYVAAGGNAADWYGSK